VQNAAGLSVAARMFAAANRAGHLAVADYANTRNPKQISADGTGRGSRLL
jgi:RND superfamily putative drug exporter